MNRRNLLKGIAASSAMSVGITGASRGPNARRADIEQLDRILVKDSNEIVETVENPTWDDVKRLNSETTDDQQVVSPENDCYEYCRINCDPYCETCMYACSNCCDAEQEICDC